MLIATKKVKHMKLFIGLMALIGIWGGLAVTAEQPPVRMLPPTVSVAAGEKWTITLPSNPTTGYRWHLAAPVDAAVMKFVSSNFVSSAERPPVGGSERQLRLGVGGFEKWTFEGVQAGTANITLNYARSWEKNPPPGQSTNVVVIVKKAAAK